MEATCFGRTPLLQQFKARVLENPTIKKPMYNEYLNGLSSPRVIYYILFPTFPPVYYNSCLSYTSPY